MHCSQLVPKHTVYCDIVKIKSVFKHFLLTGRADELLKKYREIKESHSLLVVKVANLTAER